jgi:cation transport protein ChaC
VDLRLRITDLPPGVRLPRTPAGLRAGMVASVLAGLSRPSRRTGSDPEGLCGGCAFRIDPVHADGILRAIDTREQAGFSRQHLALLPAPDEPPFAEGITWVADPDNPHFLGPLPEPTIAEIIATRAGPSGPNQDYALQLFEALCELDIMDSHVERIVRHLGRATP